MLNNTYRIFLASSYELKEDREQFEIFINRQNKALQKKNVFLELVIWEDLGDAVSLTRKQDNYNEELKTCHIFIVLCWTKMGKYTNEEFDVAWKQFKLTKIQPQVYVYEKTSHEPGIFKKVLPYFFRGKLEKNKKSLELFQQKLRDIEHFPAQYENYYHFENDFRRNLDILFTSGYLKYGEMAECLYTDGNSIPVNFIGREAELKSIREKLEIDGSLMLINAEGGIGKTSLAAKYWNESLYCYKYNAWLFCENGIEPELKKLAPKLNADLNGLNEKQQLEVLKSALLDISKDFLLVLDNANNSKDIEDFQRNFRGFHWHVLITSRCRGVLEKNHELPIVHLPPSSAKELFINNYREDTPEFDALLDRLLAAIDYHTLLVEIFSKNMKHLREFGETLADFLTQLETNGLFLEKRSFNIVTDYPDNRRKQAKSSDEIIEILYDFSQLQETERYYMVNLALLPAVNYELVFLIDLFTQEDKYTLREILQNLAKKGWLSPEENGYRMSPVVQRLVLHKHKDTLEGDSKTLLDNLNKKLANDGTYLINLTDAAPFAQLILNITKYLEKHPFHSLGLLNSNVCAYYLAIGDLSGALKAAKNYKMICELIQDKTGLAISYSKLFDVYKGLGDLDKTLGICQKYNELAILLYQEYPDKAWYKDQLAVSYQNLGVIYSALEKFEEALNYYQKYNELEIQLYQECPDHAEFKRGVAISYELLGVTYFDLFRLDKALYYFQKHNELETELYKEHPDNLSYKKGIAVSYQRLGEINTILNELDKALHFFTKSNELIKQLYESNLNNIDFKYGLAVSYNYLGIIRLERSETELARIHHYQAMHLYEELVAASPQMINYRENLNKVRRKLNKIK